MGALSAAVPMKVNLDLQLILMASNSYRPFGKWISKGLEIAKAKTIFQKLVQITY